MALPPTSLPRPLVNAKRLLSIDGGGVKGCSSVLILDAILARVREIEKKPKDSSGYFAHKYFDLAGGTSTGGLAALMMFRLKLSTAETMLNYDKMAQQIFSPRVMGFDLQEKLGKTGYWLGNVLLKWRALAYPSRFPPEPLEKAIENVVGSKDMILLDEPNSPKMFLCSTLADKGETILFRSYRPPADAAPVSTAAKSADFSDVTILQAARATSAAPTYFPPMSIKRMATTPEGDTKSTEFIFWDGGVLNNNPIDQVWDARYDLADNLSQTPVVSCVVSIGTSYADPKPPASSGFLQRFVYTISQTLSFVTNTEAKHKDFQRKIYRRNERLPEDQKTKYFRFNVPTHDKEFPMDDWRKMTELKKLTTIYLEDPEVKIKIGECAQILASQS